MVVTTPTMETLKNPKMVGTDLNQIFRVPLLLEDLPLGREKDSESHSLRTDHIAVLVTVKK
jgi:hypothetical protein